MTIRKVVVSREDFEPVDDHWVQVRHDLGTRDVVVTFMDVHHEQDLGLPRPGALGVGRMVAFTTMNSIEFTDHQNIARVVIIG